MLGRLAGGRRLQSFWLALAQAPATTAALQADACRLAWGGLLGSGLCDTLPAPLAAVRHAQLGVAPLLAGLHHTTRHSGLTTAPAPTQHWGVATAARQALRGWVGLTATSLLTTPTTALAPARPAAYAALRTDVGTMRRLRVTKGVCLPANVHIHGIFGSKDVIHSWAIPALGVKVDCIPGYSSHRRLVFRWLGVYWGQCMEVCGRYHHWMPLSVRIVHRDAFCAWCLTYLRTAPGGAAAAVAAPTVARLADVWVRAGVSLNGVRA